MVEKVPLEGLRTANSMLIIGKKYLKKEKTMPKSQRGGMKKKKKSQRGGKGSRRG